MSPSKFERQRVLANLLHAGTLSSQDELAERLAGLGHMVTQATISRDLEQLGAVKVRRGRQLTYALPAPPHPADAQRLGGVLREWAQSIETAANLVVVKTPPGSAHLVGVVLDASELSYIVGTICGDDTIFIACRSASDAELLASDLRSASVDFQ